MKLDEAYAIIESNELTRFIQKHSNNEYAVVSACRGELTSTENKKRTNELKNKLQNSKFSFKPVKGGYIENIKTPEQKEVSENSFMIYGFSKNGEQLAEKELFNFAIKLCKEYNQDTILYSKNGKNIYFDKNGKKIFLPGDKMVFNNKDEVFFSEFGKNKRFTLKQEK